MRLPFVSRDRDVQGNFDWLLTRLASLDSRLGALPRVVRGTATSAGAVSVGSGWTVSKTGTGAYTVTFSTAFSGVPSVVVSVEGGAAVTAKTGTRSTSSFTVSTFTTNTGANIDAAFNFVAVGDST